MSTFVETRGAQTSYPSIEIEGDGRVEDTSSAIRPPRQSDELGVEAANSVLDLIGETPLLRLNHRLARGIRPALYAKLEYLNPGGSVKDRIGLRMIEEAERAGLLKKGGTIVEPTSGNTGVGLAMVAALKGYKTVFIMPDKMSAEKIALLKAYGAEVVVTPTNVPRESPDSYYSVADRLARDIPGGFQPNQYFNPNNPISHYETTGPEIWRQTGGKIDVFIAGVGTGGTITGVARYLKEQNPRIIIVGVDAEGSLYTGKEVKPYKVEGVGEDFIPGTVDLKLIDEWETVGDRESFLMCRRMAREEGVLVGGSCGLALAGALRFARRIKEDKIIVVLLPDSGRGYLSKIYNDDWMRDQGFIDRFGERREVGQLVPDGSRMICAGAAETVREAIDRMHRHGISQMPVVEGRSREEEPVPQLESIVGVIEERSLLEKVFRSAETVDAPVSTVMDEPLPFVDARDDVETLFPLFTDGGNGAVVVRDGAPVGVITRSDLLEFVAHQPQQPTGLETANELIPVREAARLPRPLEKEQTIMKSDPSGSRFETRAIHAGQPPDPATGAVAVPIYQTSTFAQHAVGETYGGYEYARTHNPTRKALEECIASLEGGRFGLAFASGMAAITTLCYLLNPGDHVVLSDDVYGGTYRLFARVLSRYGIRFDLVDLTDVQRAQQVFRPETKLVWLETPTNPWLKCIDIAAVAELAHANGAWLAVDNTFASPYLQRPLRLGADFVVHSATKYLGGHSDVVGGLIALNAEALRDQLAYYQNAVGGVPGPLDCFLVLRGIKTLGVRMRQHGQNARLVAEYLSEHAAVAQVYYPGLPASPQHAVARANQLSGGAVEGASNVNEAISRAGFGGMVSFVARGGEAAARAMVACTTIFTLAESLGGVESLIEHPGAMTHASLAGSSIEIDPALVRLSVGIEDSDDLIADLSQALLS